MARIQAASFYAIAKQWFDRGFPNASALEVVVGLELIPSLIQCCKDGRADHLLLCGSRLRNLFEEVSI